jgi:PAS domain S-box-containing protein
MGYRWRILLVDDDEDDYLITREMLAGAQGGQMKLEWEATYEGALRCLLEGAPYDAVLMDYDLGLHTGIELIRTATAAGYPAPFILLTGRGSYEVDVEAMQAGASMYLTKNEVKPLLLERFIRYAIERKQAERALQQSEERFRHLADSMPQLVWTARPDGKVDYYNHRYREYGGIEPGPDGAWAWGPVLHPDDLQATLDAWQHSLASGSMYEVEHRVRLANGEFRWHLSRGVPARNEQGEIVKWYGTATDIHETRLSQEALQQSEERFQLASQAVQGVVYEWSSDRQHLYQSEGLEPLVGYKPGDEPGGSAFWWPNHIHPDDLKRVQAELQAAIDGGRDSVAYEYRIQHRDGHWVDIWDQAQIVRDAAGKLDRVVGWCTDISTRKQAEQALRESEERYRQLFENHHTPMLLIDPSDGQIMSANPAASRFYGWSQEELTRKRITEINTLSPEEVKTEMQRAQAAIGSTEFFFRHRLANGDVRDVEVHSGEILSGGRNLLFSLVLDVTARKRAEARLRELERERKSLARSSRKKGA